MQRRFLHIFSSGKKSFRGQRNANRQNRSKQTDSVSSMAESWG